jgi:hypothetical protein
MTGMRRILPAGLLVLLVAAPAIAQPSAIRPGDIRCPDCAVSGQKPATAAFDASQIEFVANPTPPFDENRTIRIRVIARVLQPAPLILEGLDSRFETLDRNMRVVDTGSRAADDSSGCLLVEPPPPVDLASKAVVRALRLNDIVTADVILNRDPQFPEALLGATPTLTNVRKAAAPVPFFHAGRVKPECADRSGRLVEYLGAEDGELTIVYNDGVIYHRNGAYLTFTRERLSPTELSDLLHAFRDANFDAMPTTFPQRQSANRPSLALIAARYQRVALRDSDARLDPLLKRIDALADRATSHAHYLLKSAPGESIVVTPWANADVDLARLVDTGIRLSDKAPDAWRRPVPPDLLLSLPAETNTADQGDSDPNRVVYFLQAGRLYRVTRPYFCADVRACTFRELSAAEVTEPLFGTCEPGTTNCQTSIYSDGRREHTRRDPGLTAISGRLWPQSMGVKLRDVPPNGLTFSMDEYNRHKAIYFPIMKSHQFGPNYIEDGILYPHVRVCLIEEGGDPATCEGTTSNVLVQQPQPAAVTRANEEIRTRVMSAPSRANLPALNVDTLDRVFLMEGVGEWRPYLSGSIRLLAEVAGGPTFAPRSERLSYSVYYSRTTARPDDVTAVSVHITQYPNAEWARFDVLNSTGQAGLPRLSQFGNTYYQNGPYFSWSSSDRLIVLNCQCTPPVIDEFLKAYLAKYPSDL